MPGYEIIGQEEFEEVSQVFEKGGILFRHGFDQLRGDSYKVRQFEESFSKKMNCKYSLAVSSGTAALRVALAALGIGKGDEVITQSFTFVATVEAIIESGASPKCVNIDETLNIDPAELEKNISPSTKAVIAVHMLGTPCNIKQVREICQKYNLFLIEDTAWGCGGNVDGRALGTWGDIGAFSFDFAKTITTGEGGMVIFDDKELFEKAAAWHDHGHENNPNVPRWEDTRSSSGFNFRMMELQGAVGVAQLKKLESVVISQRKNMELIWEEIKDIPGIMPRKVPEGSYVTADALVCFVDDSVKAIKCREELLRIGLSTKILPEAYTWHFAGTWEHMNELVHSHNGCLAQDLEKSKDILRRAVSIPIGVNLDQDIPFKIRNAFVNAISS